MTSLYGQSPPSPNLPIVVFVFHEGLNGGSTCRLSVKTFDLCRLPVNLSYLFVACRYFFPRFVGSQLYFRPLSLVGQPHSHPLSQFPSVCVIFFISRSLAVHLRDFSLLNCGILTIWSTKYTRQMRNFSHAFLAKLQKPNAKTHEQSTIDCQVLMTNHSIYNHSWLSFHFFTLSFSLYAQ